VRVTERVNDEIIADSRATDMSDAGASRRGQANTSASGTGTAADGETLLPRMQELIGRNKRVLLLGYKVDLVPLLHDHGCSIVVVGTTREAVEQVGVLCERIVVGDLDAIDIAGELSGEEVDVVVSVDSLSGVRHPLQVLQTVRKLLTPDGYLVASVPNVAYASVRLALLEGVFSPEKGVLADDQPLHFFTRESLERLIQQADFGLAQLQREDVAPDASMFPTGKPGFPSELRTYLLQDAEALTRRYIIRAYPMPREDLELMQQRLQSLVEDNESAHHRLQELDELVLRVKQQERGIAFLRSEISRREKIAADLQEHVHGLIGALGQRDAEITEKELSIQEFRASGMQQLAVIAELRAQLAHVTAEVGAYRQSKLVRVVRLYWSVRQRLF
jgi:SAM-dependent methyltransferase